jgi:hypothetical protein
MVIPSGFPLQVLVETEWMKAQADRSASGQPSTVI